MKKKWRIAAGLKEIRILYSINSIILFWMYHPELSMILMSGCSDVGDDNFIEVFLLPPPPPVTPRKHCVCDKSFVFWLLPRLWLEYVSADLTPRFFCFRVRRVFIYFFVVSSFVLKDRFCFSVRFLPFPFLFVLVARQKVFDFDFDFDFFFFLSYFSFFCCSRNDYE